MSTKKEKLSAIWKVLFSYLVVSKVLYYFDIVTPALIQGGLWSVGAAVLTRFLAQDILIILILLLTFNTEKFVTLKISKYSKTVNIMIVHIIDYVLYMGVLVIYFGGMMFFGFFQNMSWHIILIQISILYIAIVAAIEIKKYLKKKEMAGYNPILSNDEKLDMLKALLYNNVLTQAEYDHKKETLQSA